MTSFYDKLRSAQRQPHRSSIAKLKAVFQALDDSKLLQALEGKVHRGCQGYPVEALWHSYLATYVLNLPTVAALVRTLQDNPSLATACGLNSRAIPSEATYSRFVARLTRRNGLVRKLIRDSVQRLKDYLPDFGRIVAIDSTDITAYSQSRKPSDPDAHWAKKRNKHGKDHWWFGYKAHIIADATYELPLHVEVTSANINDSQYLVPAFRHSRLKPSYVLADAGYDAWDNYRYVHDDLKAIPIIKLNRRGSKNPDRMPHRTKTQIKGHKLRKFAGIDRESPKWEALYAKRTSSERLFSRMKEFRRLASIHHKGLAKVTIHCYLSTLTVVLSALSAIYSGQSLRKVA